MTPQHEIDAVYRLVAKRNKLTLINIIGIVLILLAQFVLLKFVSMEIMSFYPLIIMTWGVIFVTLIIKVNIKINKACKNLTAQIRERQNVREPRQDSGQSDGHAQ